MAGLHGFGGDAVTVSEQLLEFSVDKPASQKTPERTKRQFVVNAVLKNGGTGALGRKKMGVLPVAKGAGKLDISELASFDIVAVFKDPADVERPVAASFSVWPWHVQRRHGTYIVRRPSAADSCIAP